MFCHVFSGKQATSLVRTAKRRRVTRFARWQLPLSQFSLADLMFKSGNAGIDKRVCSWGLAPIDYITEPYEI